MNELVIDEGTDSVRAEIEMNLAGRIGRAVEKAYPNRPWRISVDAVNKIVVVACPHVSLRKGWHFPMADMTLHAMQRKAVKAAGEVLERAGLSRSRRTDGSDAEGVPRDPVRPDEADLPDTEPELDHGFVRR